MTSPALNHLLRTMAAVPTGQRVLLRGTEEGRLARPLAQLGFEVHAAPWTDEAARRVQEAVEGADDQPAKGPSASGPERTAPVYATAAPLRALPYPGAHFGWVVAQMPQPEDGVAAESQEALQALLEEARHHLRPGGWVYVVAPAAETDALPAFTPETFNRAARQAALAEAEAPARAETRNQQAVLHAIYRRVEDDTPR